MEVLIQLSCLRRDEGGGSSLHGLLPVWEAGASEKACQAHDMRTEKELERGFPKSPQATVSDGDKKMTQTFTQC